MDINLESPVLDYSARIIADSISRAGARITTMEVVIPRFVLSEFNTHRVFSRNSASSRAIRTIIMLNRVLDSPFYPQVFGLNQKGMQPGQFVKPGDAQYDLLKETWLEARDLNVIQAVKMVVGRSRASRLETIYASTGKIDRTLLNDLMTTYERDLKADELPIDALNVHKQYVNRLLENWSWQTIIVTATDWDNFFALRDNPEAQEEIARPAELMRAALKASTPTLLEEGQWHLPFIRKEELAREDVNIEVWKKVSSSRSAGVSYLTHAQAKDLTPELFRFERLANSGHMSPLEHVATPLANAEKQSGNFHGFHQWRKSFIYEDNFGDFLSTLDVDADE